MEEMLYILSLSFQVAGALILLRKSLKEKVLDKAKEIYVSEFKGPLMCEDNKIVLYKERIQEIAMDIYIDRIAFLYLTIGYSISIFGKYDTDTSKGKIVILEILVSIALIAAGTKISKIITKKRFNKNIEEDINNLKFSKGTAIIGVVNDETK
ncbi:MAG: hypothetical protein SO128_07555 [Clostridium cadaveris]|uniref:hypothetical protein n=1 Tax=Clostridium cadaveris TaxID=1529 RepID=UPI002A8B4464|nr:hypothetical protein [Clostridium cadaveris]